MSEANQRTQVESPFLKKQTTRLSFSSMMIMLLVVVSAGISLLLYYAFKVPAITEDINAWLGRPNPPYDMGEARKAQVIFALIVYTAPLALGLLVYVMHYGFNWLNRAPEESEEDERFRMD